MCLGKSFGVHLADGDRYILHYEGRKYLYTLKQTPNGFELVPSCKSAPIGAVYFCNKDRYDFERLAVRSRNENRLN